MRATPGSLIAAALLVVLGACSATSTNESADDQRPTPNPPVPSTQASTDSPPTPTTDAEEATALRFLEAWAQPGISYEQWWSDLAPLLNAAGKQTFAGTDPAVIPALDLTGISELEPSEINTWALVWVDTSEGRFGVQLQRPTGEHAWLVSRLWFPGDEPAL